MDIPINVQDNKDEHIGHNHNEHEEHDHSNTNGSGRTGIVIAVILVVAAGIWLASRNQDTANLLGGGNGDAGQNGQPSSALGVRMENEAPAADAQAIAMQSSFLANIADIDFKNTGALADVSGGNASGTVGADVIDSVYHLYASFENLPEPEEGYFYEGWIVSTDPLSVISTGEVTEYNGKTVNAYLSRANLIGHNTYVLTLEPRDSDPAPAEHVLEGVIEISK